MSEQTPTSTGDLSGVEPSMEDILASIRKIISEDEPVALESPEDLSPVELVSGAAAASTGEALSSFRQNASDSGTALHGAEGGSVDLDIEEVLAGMEDEEMLSDDLQIPDIPVDASEDFSIDSLMEELDAPDTSAVVDLDNATEAVIENDNEIFDVLDAGTEGNSDALEALAEVDDTPALVSELTDLPDVEVEDVFDSVEADDLDSLLDLDAVAESDDVEMDALLDDILLSPDDAVDELIEDAADDAVADTVEDLALDDVLDDDLDEVETLSEAEQSDLDLVKSLMAELADDPSVGDIALDTELDALTDIEDAADMSLDEITLSEDLEAGDITSELMDDAEDGDILDDILDMTLEDELQNQPEDVDLGDLDLGDLASLDDVAAAEQENILENILEDVAPAEAEMAHDADLPSLAEIAAAAEADAMAVETTGTFTSVAAGLGGAAAGAGLAAMAAKVADAPEAEVDTSTVETSTDIQTQDTQTQSLPTQETSMPVKAVKTDAIIDEVTETATTGAFAELNQVVENKAVFNESGPRIGDLVQDALRPMLKEWLDANLKGIVERAVTKEVKRISKGG